MATYALTFATRAAFDTSLASGDIYNLMQGVTSSKPSVAITATITESGETFACGTNVMVDIKSVGPGDRIMYERDDHDDPVNGVFNGRFFGIASKWIDNNYPAQPTQHIMIFKTGVLPARYVDCGVCVRRFGNRIRIAGAGANKPWSTETSTSGSYEWEVAALTNYSAIVKKSRTTTTSANANAWCAFPSLRYGEAYYTSGNSTYWPIRRETWNKAVSNWYTSVQENGKTIILSDYDNSYDKYLAINWQPLYPSTSGAIADGNGRKNTAAIIEDFAENHSLSIGSNAHAAGYCHGYYVAAPGLYRYNWFLGTLADIGEVVALSHALPVPAAWGVNYWWASTQSNAGYAWVVASNGVYRQYQKFYKLQALPLADLILEN